MSSDCFFLRHAESEANAEGWLDGQGEARLTPRGWEQARALRREAQEAGWDAIVSSDQLRVRQTLSGVFGEPPVGLFTKALRERALGEWQGWTRSRLRREDLMERLLSWEQRPPGGESHRDIAQRSLCFLSLQPQESALLIASHAGVLRVLIGLIDGLPLSQIGLQKIPNAVLLHRRLPSGGWSVLRQRAGLT